MRVLAILFTLALISVLPQSAKAFGRCTEPGYLAEFIAGLAPQPCDEDFYTTIRATSGTATLRFISLPSTEGRDVGDWHPQASAVADGVGRALDALGAGRLPSEITVVLSYKPMSTAELDEVHADATIIDPSGECRVTFYKLAEGADPDLFSFSLAHEIFHCIQHTTWHGAAAGEASSWWVEGSAEYFAYLALPGIAVSDDWINAFTEDSYTMDPTQMRYQNVVLFAWLGHRGGPAAVGAFLTQMRRGDQMAVLRSLVPEADWISFVETWLEGEILLPGGRAIEPVFWGRQHVFRQSGTLTLTARPYVIDRAGADFVANKHFDLTHAITGSGHLAMRPSEGGEWSDPPATISTCDGAQRHFLYMTTTEGTGEGTLNVTTDTGGGGGACCLVGEWAPTPKALEGQAVMSEDIGAALMMFGHGSGISMCNHRGGDWRLTFREDGTGTLGFNDQTTSCMLSTDKGDIETRTIVRGATEFDWQVREDGVAMAWYGDSTVTTEGKVRLGGLDMNALPPSEDGVPFLPNAFSFACTPDSLTIKGLYGLSAAVEAEHTRIAPP
jgi:hypothetical protein